MILSGLGWLLAAASVPGRVSLDGVLDGLEEWLYSEEAEEADLPALKAKRQKVHFAAAGAAAGVLSLAAAFDVDPTFQPCLALNLNLNLPESESESESMLCVVYGCARR